MFPISVVVRDFVGVCAFPLPPPPPPPLLLKEKTYDDLSRARNIFLLFSVVPFMLYVSASPGGPSSCAFAERACFVARKANTEGVIVGERGGGIWRLFCVACVIICWDERNVAFLVFCFLPLGPEIKKLVFHHVWARNICSIRGQILAVISVCLL